MHSGQLFMQLDRRRLVHDNTNKMPRLNLLRRRCTPYQHHTTYITKTKPTGKSSETISLRGSQSSARCVPRHDRRAFLPKQMKPLRFLWSNQIWCSRLFALDNTLYIRGAFAINSVCGTVHTYLDLEKIKEFRVCLEMAVA